MSLEAFLEDAIRKAIREELRAFFAQMPKPSDDRRVTRTEAAAACVVSNATIKSWAARGVIREYGKGRGVRYSLSEVLAVKPDITTPAANGEAIAEAIFRRKHG